ncbi:MAG: glycoside hydrolase family 1 protein [Acutalibacteraceae bacterium]
MADKFPENFLWGAATAAAQIEGGWNENGRTPSIWDIAPQKKIKHGHNCHIACDHFHRYKEDVALMKKMGLKSYRFSVSWSRVMPQEGVVSKAGLEFYENLVDELLKSGIEPLCTFYHWDMPVWVYKKDGLTNRKTVDDFAEYVKVVTEALSPKVKYWMTINEPSVFMGAGYSIGLHAPFEKAPFKAPVLIKNILRYHSAAVRTVRRYAKQPPKIGLALAVNAYIPKDESSYEIEKARKITFSNSLKVFDCNWWADAIVKGSSDDKVIEAVAGKNEMAQNCEKLDFLGVNVYRPLNYICQKKYRQTPDEGIARNSLGWELCPETLYWVLRFFSERYKLPILVTENGMCAYDGKLSDGSVHDGHRIAYLEKTLAGVKRAVGESIKVLGYQYWSLLDNFEWAEGYDPRFGLVFVDYVTQERTIKESGYYFKKVIESNGEIL